MEKQIKFTTKKTKRNEDIEDSQKNIDYKRKKLMK